MYIKRGNVKITKIISDLRDAIVDSKKIQRVRHLIKRYCILLAKSQNSCSAVSKFLLTTVCLFSEMMCWALFQLIGDDVKIAFEADDDVTKGEKHDFIFCFCSVLFCIVFRSLLV